MVEDPRQRLRGHFADVLSQQLAELDLLAQDAARDADVADALVFELERMRGTALSLAVTDVAQAAGEAIDEVRAGRPREAVARFATACRGLDDSSPGVFHPVVLIGVNLPDARSWAWMVRSAPDVETALNRKGGAAAYVVRADLAPALASRLRRLASPAPFYVVGSRHDFQGRLGAARLGAAGVLSEPIDIGALVSRVRLTDDVVEWLPSRVLVIHADRGVAENLRATLSGPDMLVQRVVDGAHVLVALDTFWPDLIVLAPDAGTVSGREVIAVVRGHPQFADTPMLLLVRPEDEGRREVMAAADELLHVALLEPSLLRARVRAWAQRVRAVRAAQEVDLATGVRSRGALLRAMERELALARRAGTHLSLALLDLDGLANINAAHGTPAGDQVLRALTERVGGAVRATDLVGRLGVDSFALLMPDCLADDAARRVDEVRARFGDWVRGQGLADVGFSAGIVDTRAGHHDLLARAHRALTDARRAGGGRSAVIGA